MSIHSPSPSPEAGETLGDRRSSGVEASATHVIDIPDGAIVTVTPNPCMDSTATISTSLRRGGVNRIADVADIPAGKGINVAMATFRANQPTVAIAPTYSADPYASLVHDTGLTFSPTPASSPVRINLTIAEPDGTTTKFNEPGTPLTADQSEAFTNAIRGAATKASWIVLAGSLPPGLPPSWYADTITAIRDAAGDHNVNVAVDTSDTPLQTLRAHMLGDPSTAPDLLKPSGYEIGQLLGIDGRAIEVEASRGNISPAADAAAHLVEHGVSYVLLTLGASGAVLATKNGIWYATPPPITPVNTVGAGDSSLAGFIIGLQSGNDGVGNSTTTDNHAEKTALQYAVAYGSAATSLPGTTIPSPSETHPESVIITAVADAAALKGLP